MAVKPLIVSVAFTLASLPQESHAASPSPESIPTVSTITSSLRDKFPAPSKTEVVDRLNREMGFGYNQCDDFIPAFTYSTSLPSDSPTSTSSRFSILKCFPEPGLGGVPGIVTLVKERLGSPGGPDENLARYFLAYFLGGDKMCEQSFETSYGSIYGFKEIQSTPTIGKLLLVYRNEGANSRTVTHDLYRIERECFSLVWRWKDEFSYNRFSPYSTSHIDLQSVSSGDSARITVYTTHVSHAESPPDKESVRYTQSMFVWDPRAQVFVLERQDQYK